MVLSAEEMNAVRTAAQGYASRPATLRPEDYEAALPGLWPMFFSGQVRPLALGPGSG